MKINEIKKFAHSVLLFKIPSPLIKILTSSDTCLVKGSWKLLIILNFHFGATIRSGWGELPSVSVGDYIPAGFVLCLKKAMFTMF